jgi:hypothetical protein
MSEATINNFLEAWSKLERITYGMLTEIHGHPADLVRLEDWLKKKFPAPSRPNVDISIGVRFKMNGDVEPGHIRLYFKGKPPMTVKLDIP